MTIETNITSRRELAGAIAQFMKTRAVYLGPPTFAYQIGDIHLSREGMLERQEADVEFDAGTFVAMVERVIVSRTEDDKGLNLRFVLRNRRGIIIGI